MVDSTATATETTIAGLTQVASLTGSEVFAVDQGGATKKAAINQIPGGIAAPLIVVSANNDFPQSRLLTAGTGISFTDAGAGGAFTISATGGGNAPDSATYLTLTANGSLSNGRTFAVSTGLTAVDGGAGSTYTISVTGNLLGLQSLGGTGPVLKDGVGSFTVGPIDCSTDLSGNLPVSVFNGGTGAVNSAVWAGDATWTDITTMIGRSSNATLPGTEGITLPNGTTAQRDSTPPDWQFRANTTTGLLEYYNGSIWTALSAASYTGESWQLNGTFVANQGTANLTTTTDIVPSVVDDVPNTRVNISLDLATQTSGGSYGSSSQSVALTVNSKGVVTAAANVAITPSAIGALADSGSNGIVARTAASVTTNVTVAARLSYTGTTLDLATTIVGAGPTGSSSVVPVLTYDNYGRLTAVTTATITPSAIGALADAAGNGMLARTAANTTTARTITGSTYISVTNGDGVSGNPTIAITGQIPLANGGTAASLTADNGAIVYSTAGALALLASTATAGKLLRSGSSAAPSWSTATFPDTAGTSGKFLQSDGANIVTSTVVLPSSTTINQILYSSAANTVGGITTANTSALVTNSSGVPSFTSGGTANRLLRTNGSAITFAQASLTTDVTGILPVANGGTGIAYFTVAGPTATRTYTFPDANTTVAGLGTTQTFTGVNTFSAATRGTISNLTDGATITPDFSLANNFAVALGGNRTLGNPTNLAQGQSGVINVWQDSTGTRTLGYDWGYQWPGGTAGVLSTTAGTRDSLAYYVDVYATSTFTVTIASPGVVTWTSHGLQWGQKVRLTTTGALPTGLATGTTYFVKTVDANSFQLAATLGGTSINTSGSQSGTHTGTAVAISLSLNKAWS